MIQRKRATMMKKDGTTRHPEQKNLEKFQICLLLSRKVRLALKFRAKAKQAKQFQVKLRQVHQV